ncbi:ABC transporter ATP-binding protein [Ferrovibrio terrae]|uniref:ABC transporter ATP-binding protein n=1 Tax=Ferrovibrio terrae TaxID=2594003 RepID=UPI00163DB283|nr:ABC transporter ATP-binding protein [Ferrovibrio terrae]
MALLEVDDLRTHFATEGGGEFRAVDGISFAVESGKTLGIVGESGCGKSVTSLTVMGLLPSRGARIASGSIRFAGKDLRGLSADDLRDLRGNRLAMIFQEPMTSLNPAYTIGDQIMEGLTRHKGLTGAQAREQAIAMLRKVKIPAPEKRVDDYPHQLSGGMRQRAMIAMALACGPELLIADEPTTALDVTVQAQILDLLRELQRDLGTAIMLISHDMGVIAEMADHVAVMYAGRIVEQAPVEQLFDAPQHPYTIGLLGSIPRLDHTKDRLASIEGSVPDPLDPPPGCSFSPRCPFAEAECRTAAPALREVLPGHAVACWKAPLI